MQEDGKHESTWLLSLAAPRRGFTRLPQVCSGKKTVAENPSVQSTRTVIRKDITKSRHLAALQLLETQIAQQAAPLC